MLTLPLLAAGYSIAITGSLLRLHPCPIARKVGEELEKSGEYVAKKVLTPKSK